MALRPILMAIVTAATILSSASAQIGERKLGKILDRKIVHAPVPRRSVIVELKTLPSDMVEFSHAEGWSITRAPRYSGGGIPPAVDGAYAELVRMAPRGQLCSNQTYQASINLARIRANGFRLAEYTFDPVSPPRGYAFESNGPHRSPGDGGVPPGTLTSIQATRGILAQVLSPDPRLPRLCWSGFHVRIKLRGPEGIDPLSGQPIAPHGQVH